MDKHEFRRVIYAAGVKQWELAEELGIREEALSRRLRHELSQEDEEAVKRAVNRILAKKEKNDAKDPTE